MTRTTASGHAHTVVHGVDKNLGRSTHGANTQQETQVVNLKRMSDEMMDEELWEEIRPNCYVMTTTKRSMCEVREASCEL